MPRLVCLQALIMACLICSYACAQSPVVFVDPILKQAVEGDLGVTDPTPVDMLSLSCLNASDLGITDLTGLEYATNLQQAYLSNNNISSLDPLSGLSSLTLLQIRDNQISSLSSLSGLSSLRSLSAAENQVSDLSGLSGLSSLTELDIGHNEISDVSPLVSLTQLTGLDLAVNQIGDISALSSLTSLTSLSLTGNQISSISPLFSLTNLSQLTLGDNQISDISVLSGLTLLEGLYLENNEISDISSLTSLTQLLWLDLHGNPLSTESCEVYVQQIIDNSSGVQIWYDCVGIRIPRVRTYAVTEYGSYLARLDGIIEDDGDDPNGCRYRFTYWQEGHSVTTTDWACCAFTGESFSQDITGLVPQTKYFFYAEAESAAGSARGQQYDFTTVAPPVVHFRDSVLKQVVENSLGIIDPTPTDMLCLTELSYAGQDEVITSLVGLEYAANLQELYLRFNQISDLSPLSGLTNLRSIDLSRNEISDLSPLSGLDRLQYLNIHGNKISDLSPLSSLTGLDTLILRFNEISDISPLSPLTNLWELDLGCNQINNITPLASLSLLASLCLWDNQINDITPLARLTALLSLDADMNLISDVTPLAGMEELYDLDLADNAITDVGPLCHLMSLTYLNLQNNPLTRESCDVYIPEIVANNPRLFMYYDAPVGGILSINSTVGGSVVDPGEGNFTYNQDDIPVRLEARARPGFTFVGWSGGISSTQNPTLVTVDRDLLIRATFQSVQEVLYVDDDGAADPGPDDGVLSDANEDGTDAHPFDTIQEAIDVAGPAVTVYVYPGIYRENIDFAGKDIRVLGIDTCQDVVKGPLAVIAGLGAEPVVRFEEGAGAECVLAGFVITQGEAAPAGAILCDGASPTIANCLIVGNRITAADGAAVYCRNSLAVLASCTIADNYAGTQGAGLILVDSDVTIVNSILWGNVPVGILLLGTSRPTVHYCDLEGGYWDEGTIETDPMFAARGSWVYPEDPNDPLDPTDPRAVWAAGDYHLMSRGGRWYPPGRVWVRDEQTSPCIDMGDPNSPVGDEPEPNGGIINMGAYGATAEASISP